MYLKLNVGLNYIPKQKAVEYIIIVRYSINRNADMCGYIPVHEWTELHSDEYTNLHPKNFTDQITALL